MRAERRRKPRLDHPVPLKVRGIAPEGGRYEFRTTAENVSAGGLCALAPVQVNAGEILSLQIRFAAAGSMIRQAPTITARGVVLRAEARPGGAWMFAVEFMVRRIV